MIGTRKEAIIQNVHSSCNQQDHVYGRPRNKGTAGSRDMERKTERENPKYSTKKTRDKIEKQASREREKEGPAAIAVDDMNDASMQVAHSIGHKTGDIEDHMCSLTQ